MTQKGSFRSTGNVADVDTFFPNPLLGPVKRIVEAHPEGLSEYALIGELRRECDWIEADWARDALNLYRLHCLLFNALYQWQQACLQANDGYLQVSALKICRMPARPLQSGDWPTSLAVSDAVDTRLAEFYLDWRQWSEADRDEVDRLLQQFWTRYRHASVSDEQRVRALAILQLQDPVSAADIRLAYRRLIAKHHPDRGGDTAYVQTLNEAVSVLL